MERLINRTRQGDLGEASAIEWLTRQGAVVSIPQGHSPDYDLIAEMDGRLLRVQVKTSVAELVRPNGSRRFRVLIATMGGNRSWTGVVKRFDPSRFDQLFVLCGDGRRWLVPVACIDAERVIAVGGEKYSEFEIASTEPITELIYGPALA